MAERVTESSDAAWLADGWAAWSRAVRVTGTLDGEARWAAVPWAKAKPVIAPPVPRLTRAVACCHQGLRGDGTVSPSFACWQWSGRRRRSGRPGRSDRGSEPGGGEVLEDRLHPRVARAAGVLEQRLRR